MRVGATDRRRMLLLGIRPIQFSITLNSATTPPALVHSTIPTKSDEAANSCHGPGAISGLPYGGCSRMAVRRTKALAGELPSMSVKRTRALPERLFMSTPLSYAAGPKSRDARRVDSSRPARSTSAGFSLAQAGPCVTRHITGEMSRTGRPVRSAVVLGNEKHASIP